MNLAWAAGGAIAGLPIGLALRGLVFRLSVTADQPERTDCPRCGAPVRILLPVRCGQCGKAVGVPLVLECATAAVFALLFGRFSGQPELLAFGFLGAVGVALAAIDISVQRLPDRITLTALPVLLILLAIAAVLQHDMAALGRAALGGLSLGGCYLLLALVQPVQIGGGDVKLAALAGVTLGWLGWQTLLAGAALGFLLAAVVSLALLAARRISLHSAISFGPYLLGGTLLAMLGSHA